MFDRIAAAAREPEVVAPVTGRQPELNEAFAWEDLDPADVPVTHAEARASAAARAYAPIDGSNRKQERGRPAVHVGRHDQFVVASDAPRYSIVGTHSGRAFDTIAKGTHVQVNISTPRELITPEGRHAHVLVRPSHLPAMRQGSAWLRADALATDPKRLERADRKAAAHAMPAEPAGHATAYVFRTTPQTSDLALTPGSQAHKAKLDAYLEHTTPQAGGFYNVCLNLPQPGTPPVADDVARAGDHFFVFHTHEVAAYRGTHRTSTTWAFGCIGTGAKPDHTRRGWVPMATLERV